MQGLLVMGLVMQGIFIFMFSVHCFPHYLVFALKLNKMFLFFMLRRYPLDTDAGPRIMTDPKLTLLA